MEDEAVVKALAGLGAFGKADKILDGFGSLVANNLILNFPSVVSKRANVSLGIVVIVSSEENDRSKGECALKIGLRADAWAVRPIRATQASARGMGLLSRFPEGLADKRI